jgi:hypothetical protein
MNKRRVSYLVLGMVAVAVILFLTAGKVFSSKTKPVVLDKGERDNLALVGVDYAYESHIVRDSLSSGASSVTIDKGERDNFSAASTAGLSASSVTIDKGERDSLASGSKLAGQIQSPESMPGGKSYFIPWLGTSIIIANSVKGPQFYEYGPALLATGFAKPQ